MQLPSITETPNELTRDIDVVSPEGIVRLLRNTDAQIYNGYRSFPALCDEEIVEKIAMVTEWAAPLMGREDSVIVLSGAGTSGRLAMFATRMFNQLLAANKLDQNFHYIMAGSDLALIKAQEKAEDDPHTACSDIEPLIKGKKRVLYIGITCAFAAPYVAGQLAMLSRRKGAYCVLMGFNPEDRARRIEVEDWDRTFADVVKSISRKKNCVILNPIVGPEPITGSTRMKSGSATKLLLETIFAAAAGESKLAKKVPGKTLTERIRRSLLDYENTRRVVYEQSEDMANLIKLAGNALRRGGHIYYVGAGAPGILGIIDASECPPTFGAGFEDVRGFLIGGWKTLLGPDRDLSDEGVWYRISLDNFTKEKLPELNKKDFVVALPNARWDEKLKTVLRKCKRKGATVAAIQVDFAGKPGLQLDGRVCVPEVPESPLPKAQIYAEYATKLILNSLTTGGHTLCGKIYENRMVDLRISNTKLYYRTLGIIQSIMDVSMDKAKHALLKSLYGVDRVTPKLLKAKPSAHVEAATNGSRIVPRALIMAGSKANYAQADKLLKKTPIVRTAIEELKKKR